MTDFLMHGEDERSCYYCRMPLAPKHEHDHFPMPKRHGGEETVPICLNCHTLKDRQPIGDWADPGAAWAAVSDAWENCSPLGRIFLAKYVMNLYDSASPSEVAVDESDIADASNRVIGRLAEACWKAGINVQEVINQEAPEYRLEVIPV